MTDFYIHESSDIDHDVEIGVGTRVWHFCHLMTGCRIGQDCTIGQNVLIAPDVIIGNKVKIQNNVSIYSGVICEDDVFLGPSMVFTNVINPRAFIEKKEEFQTTRLKKGSTIGANATIVCGNTIGKYAMIGAGSVITRDIPDYALVYGNPACTMGWVCRCGTRLQFENRNATCTSCGLRYDYTEDNFNPVQEIDVMNMKCSSPQPPFQHIPMLDLPGQYQAIKEQIDSAIRTVVESGHYINGPAVQEFESNMAQFLKVQHAVGVASGTDALLLSLHALGINPGDLVIVPAFTFFASAEIISRLGAIPLFVDIDPETFNLDLNQAEDILKNDKSHKIKAIIPVHLFGLPANMQQVMTLSQKYNLKVIEDSCQAINADVEIKEKISENHKNQRPSASTKKTGTIGNCGCFSFFPSKNLGCFGDGGMIVTDDEQLAEKIRLLRMHGSSTKYFHKIIGYNSRLDTIQAAILNIKLKYLDEWTRRRIDVAQRYNREFEEQKLSHTVICPKIQYGHVFHQYTIRVQDRDKLARHLARKGISTAIYYPLPLHLQECYQNLGYRLGDLTNSEKACAEALALPIDPYLDQLEIAYIVNTITEFYRAK